MQILGHHLIVEYSGCDRGVLEDADLLERHLKEAVRQAGATIVSSTFHRYNPQGVSGVVVIAESHLSIHTWPEYGYAAADFFTCGEECNPELAHKYLSEKLGCRDSMVKKIDRGIPSLRTEILRHKQTPVVASAGQNP